MHSLSKMKISAIIISKTPFIRMDKIFPHHIVIIGHQCFHQPGMSLLRQAKATLEALEIIMPASTTAFLGTVILTLIMRIQHTILTKYDCQQIMK